VYPERNCRSVDSFVLSCEAIRRVFWIGYAPVVVHHRYWPCNSSEMKSDPPAARLGFARLNSAQVGRSVSCCRPIIAGRRRMAGVSARGSGVPVAAWRRRNCRVSRLTAACPAVAAAQKLCESIRTRPYTSQKND